MKTLVFPDNTVLVNFAIIKRMDLLASLIRDRGQWCATVARECERSALEPGLEAMADANAIFGDPLRPETRVEHLDIRQIRDELAEPDDGPLRHLGEAETVAIMSRRQIDGVFVTDDVGAARLADRHSVKFTTTWALLRLAHKCSLVETAVLWGYLRTLKSNHRGGPPNVHDFPSFQVWLGLIPPPASAD